MKAENQRVAITKRMLQEGLVRLLEKKDLDKISITELCRESGINRVTFYRHYEIPHDILMEMEKSLLNELKQAYPLPKSLPALRQYLEDTCSLLDDNIHLLKLIIRNNTDSDFCILFNEIMQEIWKESILTDVVEDPDPEGLQLLGIYTAGGVYFFLRQWLLGNIQKTPHEIAAIAYNMLCSTDWVGISRKFNFVPQQRREAFETPQR